MIVMNSTNLYLPSLGGDLRSNSCIRQNDFCPPQKPNRSHTATTVLEILNRQLSVLESSIRK